MSGNMDKAKGRMKQAVGDLTGDEQLEAEGEVDEAEGGLKDAVDTVKDKVNEGIDKVRDALSDD